MSARVSGRFCTVQNWVQNGRLRQGSMEANLRGCQMVAGGYPEVAAPKTPGDLRLPSRNPSGCITA